MQVSEKGFHQSAASRKVCPHAPGLAAGSRSASRADAPRRSRRRGAKLCDEEPFG